MISLIRSMLCRSLFCLRAARIKGPEARMRRNDSLIAFGSWAPPSRVAEALGAWAPGSASTCSVSGDGSVSGGAGLLSLSGFFVSDLVENSTLNGVDEDDAAAWLLRSAPH